MSLIGIWNNEIVTTNVRGHCKPPLSTIVWGGFRTFLLKMIKRDENNTPTFHRPTYGPGLYRLNRFSAIVISFEDMKRPPQIVEHYSWAIHCIICVSEPSIIYIRS